MLRGTYVPDTVRCITGVPDWYPSYVEPEFAQRSIVLECFADVRVNAYVLGSGPSRLTVLVSFYHYWYVDSMEGIRWVYELRLEEGISNPVETIPGIYGREVILFVGPGHNQATEKWEVFSTWDVQRQGEGEDETVVAVHPGRDNWRRLRPDDYETHRSALEMELPAFTRAVTVAHQAKVTEYGGRIAPADIDGKAPGVELPMITTDANGLRQFYTDTGAYSHPEGPPAQPPAPYVCNNGTAVGDSRDDRWLAYDCEALLAAEDALKGTAALNWSTSTAISNWDGVTVADTVKGAATDSRVTEIELPKAGLNGSIPAELGDLLEMTHLDLGSNSLTGEIPAELGLLGNLVEIRLSGNSLTGCIPLGLKDVATNDLSSLNLLYCRPPAPENLTAGTPAETSVPLSWGSVPNAGTYQVEYRLATSTEWHVDVDNATTTSHIVDDLNCDTDFQFRVSALGSGTVYASEWSEASDVLTAATAACPRSP